METDRAGQGEERDPEGETKWIRAEDRREGWKTETSKLLDDRREYGKRCWRLKRNSGVLLLINKLTASLS